MLRLVRRVLEREGYGVLAAENTAAARRFLDSGSVDFVLSDIDLPDGSGIGLCRWIGANPTLARMAAPAGAR